MLCSIVARHGIRKASEATVTIVTTVTFIVYRISVCQEVPWPRSVDCRHSTELSRQKQPRTRVSTSRAGPSRCLVVQLCSAHCMCCQQTFAMCKHAMLRIRSGPNPGAGCRNPQEPIVSSPRKSPEEGTEDTEAQRSVVPPRQPLVVGALAVMLLASSINEVKLGVPAVSIRLGLQVRETAVFRLHYDAQSVVTCWLACCTAPATGSFLPFPYDFRIPHQLSHLDLLRTSCAVVVRCFVTA